MLLQTERLTKHYGTARALDGLNLSVAPGEIFGLLGPNGSGKSTALRLLMGFLQPTSGTAHIAGHNCWTESVAVHRQVAYLPGELRLYESMTGAQLVSFLARLRDRGGFERLAELAQRFEIDLSRPIADLSSGMKRKVALITVLLPHVPLLILDEPTNTLDPTMRDRLLKELRVAREEGQAVLFSSHVLNEVEHTCDRVGILQRGRLVHVAKMAELRDARLVRITFQDAAPSIPPIPGVRVREQGTERVALEYAGPLPPLLEWLACQRVCDLRVEPLGLAPLYHQYHGAGE